MTNAREYGLAGIFDNVRDGLVLVRFPERIVVMFNRAAADMFGKSPASVIGARVDLLFPDPKVHEVARLCSEQPMGIYPGHMQEVLVTRVAGRRHDGTDLELHFCRVEDVGSGGPLVLVVLRPSADVEVAHATRRADEAQRRVEQLEVDAREHAQLFGEAAHEFNTPLTIVALQAELLRGALGPVVPDQGRALTVISANVKRLVLLAQDLMDLARADAGRLVIKPGAIDLRKVVHDQVDSFRALAAQQGIRMDWAASGPPAMVLGDAARLRQVVDNFLGNAVKFTPPEGRVTVELLATTEGATVRVIDSGPGMDSQDQARLFRPFVRIDTPEIPAKPGTGLGLYLSRRIIEAHSGHVGCSSPGRGKGMTFWFVLPLAAPAQAHATHPLDGRPRRRPTRPRAGATPDAQIPAQTQDAGPTRPSFSGDPPAGPAPS